MKTKIQLGEPMKILRDDNSEPLAISDKKLKGLMKLVEKRLIPRSFQNFYLSLNGTTEVNPEENDSTD